MFPYLALLWNSRCPQDQRTAEAAERQVRGLHPLWRRHLSVPGLAVYCPNASTPEGDVLPLSNKAAILLGVAFSRADQPRSLKYLGEMGASLFESDELITSRGKAAIEKIWGSFVLLITTRDFRTRYILRSPAAHIACFHARASGVHFFFSEVEDYAALNSRRLSVNWSVIRAQAAGGDYLTSATALEEITELECGECACHTESGVTRSFYWNPCEISQRPPIAKFDDAVAAVRCETMRAIHSWASRYETVLLELSGGLDSSIVLAGLATAPSAPQVYCANYYSNGCHFDERSYARGMAAKWHKPLLEYELDQVCDLSLFERCAKTARPVLSYTAPGRIRTIAEFASKYSCEAVVDGELGDHVFGSPSGAEPVTDYLHRRGPLPGVILVSRDLARLRRLSVWRALQAGFWHSLHASRSRNYLDFMKGVAGLDMEPFRFITQDALHQYERELDGLLHPWFKGEYIPRPGIVMFIYTMLMTTSTTLHSPFSVPQVPHYMRPLVNQPLIELALRIPSKFTVRNGWNRAVAREAFATDLTHDVRLRTAKANTGPWISRAIRQNSAWLRDFLLGGILARERILDSIRVEEALSERLNRSTAISGRLFIYIYIEGWLRQWAL